MVTWDIGLAEHAEEILCPGNNLRVSEIEDTADWERLFGQYDDDKAGETSSDHSTIPCASPTSASASVNQLVATAGACASAESRGDVRHKLAS